MSNARTLRVRSDTAELGRVRKRVAVWAEGAGLAERTAHRLQLAVDETVANAIEHGIEDDRRRVVIQGTLSRGRLTITVRYRGPRFDPTTAKTQSTRVALERRAEHGYGLHLIRTLVDQVDYRRDGNVNEVRLTARG
ncbi:ATP-binding protein [Rubrivirga sp.]|uniref:ATP-binding protein n=1 Tax=Rubrivirga sp. TaxID=1885344 RepID=UPI003C73AFE0